MGWVTKKSKGWEIGQLKWTVLSILMFVPHIHPFVMMAQANRSKVRSWLMLAWVLLVVEMGLLYALVTLWGSLSQGMLLTIGGFVGSYIIGNGLLLRQAKPYLKRLELNEVRPLHWISSVKAQQRLELAEAMIETPQTFISKLLHYRSRINHRNIQQYIDNILRLFRLLEQRDVQEAERFLVRHGTIVNVLREYDDLEQTKLYNQVTMDSKRQLEHVLAQATSAVELDVTNLIKSRLLDVSAESDVYLQTLRNKNLLKE